MGWTRGELSSKFLYLTFQSQPIDGEFSRQLQNDWSRWKLVFKKETMSKTNPGYDFSKKNCSIFLFLQKCKMWKISWKESRFSWGTTDSLYTEPSKKGFNLTESVKNWFDVYYSRTVFHCEKLPHHDRRIRSPVIIISILYRTQKVTLWLWRYSQVEILIESKKSLLEYLVSWETKLRKTIHMDFIQDQVHFIVSECISIIRFSL